MRNRAFPFIVPVIAFLMAITGIVVIGEFLLFVHEEFGKLVVPFAAIGLIGIIGVVATLLAVRASKLPPVEMPQAEVAAPVRRMDFGAGYIVGQFAFFLGLGLLLLFVILAIS